jgi:hypothetical protein
VSTSTPGRIYVYTAPGYDTPWMRTVGSTTIEGRGRFKVGFTSRPDTRVRIKEQTGTVYPDGDGIVVHLDEPAVRNDGTTFEDHAVFKLLDRAGIKRASEVVEATLPEIRAALAAVRAGRAYDPTRTDDFGLRPEQRQAVEVTSTYFKEHIGDSIPPRFLWNAKMRFGKTFTTYQLAKRMEWKRVLVLTYKPAVRSAWYDDLVSHVDFSDWVFADRETPCDPDTTDRVVWFASFQDLLGTTANGEVKDHNVDLHLIEWDCIVLDEYHFGAWQGAAKEVCSPASNSSAAYVRDDEEAAETAADVSDMAVSGTPRLYAATPEVEAIGQDVTSADLRLSARSYLYLSGTPFRALTEGEFNENAIFNWTYPDEQSEKVNWSSDLTKDPERNPYAELPQMQMFTYELSDITDAETAARADGFFDLSGYFAAKKVGSEYQFNDETRVREFLDLLRGRMTQSATAKLLSNFKPPFPYSDPQFTEAVEHTVWFMPNVASAHAMKAMLSAHPYFRDFLVHVAAGNAAKMGAEAKKPVDAMLAKAAKLGKQTITLTVAKLMTGVTVPQWGAMLILRSLKAPESYFQAAFRVQSPWVAKNPDGTRTIKKHTCYVFDFDPNRALSLVYQYGTKLAAGSPTTAPSEVIQELIEYLPIFAFDGGRMDAVDVNAVMDWGTAGAGAAMLAKRWGSPRLIDLSEDVLAKLLANDALMNSLEQMEDFRNLRLDADKIIANSKKARSGKKPRSLDDKTEPEDSEVAEAKKAKREQVKHLRDKLLKFAQAVPVFMYLTNFREEALTHVIDSIDTPLFERVTGLTHDDFRQLSEVGVFNKAHMDEAIWQFRLFERASLDYLGTSHCAANPDRIGLWEHSESVPRRSSVL